jgi:hypothetical protein
MRKAPQQPNQLNREELEAAAHADLADVRQTLMGRSPALAAQPRELA